MTWWAQQFNNLVALTAMCAVCKKVDTHYTVSSDGVVLCAACTPNKPQ